jgi:hypothetical protein
LHSDQLLHEFLHLLIIHKPQLFTMFIEYFTSANETASSASSCSSDLPSSSRSSSTDLFWLQDLLDDRSSTYSSSTQPDEDDIEGDWISSYDTESSTSASTSIAVCPPPSRSSTPDVDWILEVIGEPASSTFVPDDYSDVWWKYGDTFERCGEVAGKGNFDGNNFLEREGLWRVS